MNKKIQEGKVLTDKDIVKAVGQPIIKLVQA